MWCASISGPLACIQVVNLVKGVERTQSMGQHGSDWDFPSVDWIFSRVSFFVLR